MRFYLMSMIIKKGVKLMKTKQELIDLILTDDTAYNELMELQDDVFKLYDDAVSWEVSAHDIEVVELLTRTFIAIKASNNKLWGSKSIGTYIKRCPLAQFWRNQLETSIKKIAQ
tara:strand:- start:157 stop:498 length:342 start_codon:yes stop_codon:yes gene_type:complete